MMVVDTLFARLGREDGIAAAVHLFYRKVTADEIVGTFFEHMDLPRLVDKQIAFMTVAFGGPNNYTGRDLVAAHAQLVERGLSDVHFDRVVEHLEQTLRELEVDPVAIGEVVGIVESTRRDVLGRKGDAVG